MGEKEFWKSKTFWFNVLAMAVAIATSFGFSEFTPSTETEQIALVIVTTVNLILRFYTTQGVTVRPKR